VDEVVGRLEIVESALAQRRRLRRVEPAVTVQVVLLDHERAEELVESPVLAHADQLPALEHEGRHGRDPDMRMSGRRSDAAGHQQHGRERHRLPTCTHGLFSAQARAPAV
jgi:hypothetical protein